MSNKKRQISVINYYSNQYYGSIEVSNIEVANESLVSIMKSFGICDFDWNLRSDSVAAIIYIKPVKE